MCSVRIYYFPNLNEDEACIMAQGHHSYQDGISQMQSFYCFSDTYKQKGEYPFFKKPRPSILQWMAVYLSLPFTWFQFLKFYFSRPRDENCIKKHPKYMTGRLNSKLSDMISMKKAKAKAKELDSKMTFNDLILAVISTAFKEYFVSKGDDSKYMTVTFPFTFN